MTLSAFIQKLLFVKQFSLDNGKIEILGGRYIMLDASDFLVLQEIDKGKVYEGAKENAKNSLKDIVQYANVYKGLKDQSVKNIADLSKKIGKNDDGVIKTLQQIFDIYGLGKLTITELANDKKTAHLRIEHSTIAEAQLKKGPAKKPVCSITAGILAGIFSYIFNKDVNCIEESCRGVSGDMCEFWIK